MRHRFAGVPNSYHYVSECYVAVLRPNTYILLFCGAVLWEVLIPYRTNNALVYGMAFAFTEEYVLVRHPGPHSFVALSNLRS